MNERAIFVAALEKDDPAERGEYLQLSCAGDPALRERIERLLKLYGEPDSFLQLPDEETVMAATTQITEGPSTVIGPYKLLQQLGEGGFGVVFLAEQEQPVRRKVAFKIIKPGMDSKQVIARFEAERQALALMDHPNIARVLDGGTTESGRPYFVMELVKGVPITEFCDKNRLTPRERLELFIPVCQAVQHAHQKGIIHRDLKPSNVLVTMYDERPVPKVIDFGVAKAIEQKLTEKTLFTRVGQVVGTLEYMSPEQATLNALDVDTRSDVYSLGVLLYELLTGTTPLTRDRLQGVAYLEMLRLIREEEPPRPSTRLSESGDALAAYAVDRRSDSHKLPTLVRGELDWIAMKALEKDRTRRYETASALAADVRRYLNEEPVEARSPSAWYRFRKMARRNRAAVTAAALVAAALVVGIVATTWQAVRATDAEQQARTAEETTKSALGKLEQEQGKTVEALEEARRAGRLTLQTLPMLTNFVIKEQMARQPQITDQDRAFLQTVLKRYDGLVHIRGNDPESRAVRAEGYQNVGEIRAFLGEYQGARSDYERAIGLYEALAADFPRGPDYRYYLAMSHDQLGRLLTDNRNSKEAEAQHLQAHALFKQLADGLPTEPKYRYGLARSHDGLGNALRGLEKLADAEAEHRKAVDIHKQLIAKFPERRDARESLANSHNNLAVVLSDQHEYDKAVRELRAAIDLRRKLLADFPNDARLREYLGNHYNNLGNALDDLKKYEQAEIAYREAIRIRKQLTDQFPAVPSYRYKLGKCHYTLGGLLPQWGKKAKAKFEYDQALAKAKFEYDQALPLFKQLADDPANVPEYQCELGGLYCDLGNLVRTMGVAADGLPWYEEAIRTLAPLVKREPDLANARRFLRNSHAARATLLLDLGRFADAKPDWERALELTGELDKKGLCKLHLDRAQAYMKWNRFANAIKDWDRVLELAGDLDQKVLCKLHGDRAFTLMKLDRFADAIKDWDRAFKLDDGSLRAPIRSTRALCWARVDPATALAEMEALLQADAVYPPIFYDAACVYALCAARTEDADARETYAARAVALLRQAREKGYFKNSATITHMKTGPDLEPLRARPEFRKLLAELEANKK
jgi:serine/threonine protein kinase